MTLVKNKSKQQQMWQNKTVLADEPEDKRPELAPIAMLFTIINAVLCLISLLLAFVPVHIEKSIINEPTIPNLIGVISLSGVVVKITKNYVDRKIGGRDIKPMLSALDDIQELHEKEIS